MNRVKELRKNYLKLTQTEFGLKLGVSRSVINNIERDLVDLKEHMVKLICQTFNVNENWLKNGVEPIFFEDKKDIFKTLQSEYKLDDITIGLLDTFIKLDDSSKNTIINFLVNSVENYYSNRPDKLDELNKKIYDLPKNIGKNFIEKK